MQASFRSSAFPITAQELDGFNGVEGVGADRIMQLIESQSDHRQSLERLSVGADIDLRKRGLNYAFILSLIALVGGLALIAAGFDAGALGPILVAIGSLAGVFIWWQQHKQPSQIPSTQPPPGIDQGTRSKTGP